jgi:hypothetical protein
MDLLITEGYHSGGGRKFRGKVRHKSRCSWLTLWVGPGQEQM